MLVRYMDWVGNGPSNLEVPHIGIVKDNNDPLKLKRVKIWIEGLLELSTSDLPWFMQKGPVFLGGSSNSAVTNIPEVGSYVEVTFPYRDIYFGFYEGVWENTKNRKDTFDFSYPDEYGWIDSNDTKFRVNKAIGYVEFEHYAGKTKVRMLKNGDIEIYSDNNVTVVCNNDSSYETANKHSLDAGVESYEEAGTVINKKAPTINLTGNVHIHGNLTVDEADLVQIDASSIKLNEE